MNIIIDSKEPPQVVNQIKRYPAFAKAVIEVKSLPTGDVWLDNEVIIERKTITDLLASIADGRLANQAAEMRAITEWCYLVICGPLQWYNQKIIGTDWHFRSVQGALLQAQEFGVAILHAADEQDFAQTCFYLYSKDRQKRVSTLPPRRFGLPQTDDEKIISALPGIGYEKASKLLVEYGSAIKVLCHLTDDSSDLPAGFGPKIRQSTRLALGLSNNEKIERVKNEKLNN